MQIPTYKLITNYKKSYRAKKLITAAYFFLLLFCLLASYRLYVHLYRNFFVVLYDYETMLLPHDLISVDSISKDQLDKELEFIKNKSKSCLNELQDNPFVSK